MKVDKTWKVADEQKCVNKESYDDTFNLNMYPALRSTGGQNILGPFILSKNGLNYPNFQMKIERFIFKEYQAEPETKEKLGTWKTGFEGKDLITLEPGKGAIWEAHQALTVFRIVTVVVCI